MALNYEIALCSVWWCAGCENIRYFTSVAAQTAYFENLTSGLFSPLVNFNIGNNVETTVYYRDTSGRSNEALIACNYAVIRHKDTPEGDYIYRYFFARCSQDSGNQMRVELSLDDIQTNYFRYKDTIAPCIIERAHLNRWKVATPEENVLTFNSSIGSPLFKSEGNNLPKRLINRTTIVPANGAQNAGYAAWAKKYLAAWVYIFIDSSHTYSFGNQTQSTIAAMRFAGNNINYTAEWAVIVYPLYKTNAAGSVALQYGDTTYYTSDATVSRFRELNNDSSFFYSVKLSMMPPYNLDIDNVSVSGSTLTIITASPPGFPSIVPHAMSATDNTAIFSLLKQNPTSSASNIQYTPSLGILYTDNPIMERKRSDIVGANRSMFNNPKIFNEEITKLRVINGKSATEFSFLKLGNNITNDRVYFKYTEIIFPDITRSTLSINTTSRADSEIYNIYYENNFMGATNSEDLSIPVANDQLQSFLANNKNFYLQRDLRYKQEDINAFSQRIQKSISALGSAALGNPMGMIEGATSALGTFAGELNRKVNQSFDRMQSNLTLDNMEQAPDALSNSNGQAFLNVFENQDEGLYLYAETYMALDCDIKPVDDYMYMYGYVFNELGNIGDYDNIRKYFNYVQADIEIISAPISSLEEDRLKARFANGVRFWNSDTVQYTLENYENALESTT